MAMSSSTVVGYPGVDMALGASCDAITWTEESRGGCRPGLNV